MFLTKILTLFNIWSGTFNFKLMKNVHLIPTENPSNLYKTDILYRYTNGVKREPLNCTNLHLYITSEEDIKEGDWFLDLHNLDKPKFSDSQGLVDKLNLKKEQAKKIILTTDQELIEKGIQAINDEFLEWFVMNPTCEFVQIETVDTFKKTTETYTDEVAKGNYYEIVKDYRIVIPKALTKLEIAKNIAVIGIGESNQDFEYVSVGEERIKLPITEPKQETIEEAAYKYAEIYRCPATNENEYCKHDIISAINFGAKWQAEQDKKKYSEEEVKQICIDAINSCTNGTSSHCQDFDEWFEQFKNK